MNLNSIIIMIVAYFIGSIPTGFIFTSLIKGIDVREIGSGNVGATNAARALGLKYGIIVALLDVLKGVLAVSIVYIFIANPATYLPFLAGFLAILGHDHSLFLKFSGGKGVATTFGVILRLSPLIFMIIIVIWFLLSVLTRYVSVASLTAALLMPLLAIFIFDNYISLLFYGLFGLLIIIKHHENIKRLRAGEENQLGSGSDQ